jgi:hypothetical protein
MADNYISPAKAGLQDIVLCRVCGQRHPISNFYERQVRKCRTVGECKSCTKQRVRNRAMTDPKVQEYERQRSKRPHRRAHIAKTAREWNKKNPEAYRAHYLVTNAVRDGRLKKLPCLFCGDEKVHGHHRDYSKPLDVIWLCPKCHHRLHAAFPETQGHSKDGGE